METEVDQAIEEIHRRDGAFLESRTIGFASRCALVRDYAAHPLFAAWGPEAITRRIEDGLAALADHGVRVARDADCQAPIARLFCDSIVDAAAAAEGRLPLGEAAPRMPLESTLCGYDRRSIDGCDYIVGQRGSRPLLIVNAIGIPLSVWSRLLGDPDHDFRIIVVESACSDLIEGGMRAAGGLDAEVSRIQAVLAAEDAHRVVVIGWCSGGRVAVELAAREAERVSDLVLIGATFRGAMADEPPRTQFEEDVLGMFNGVRSNPAAANFLSKMLVQSQGIAPAAAEAAALFRLPAREDAAALTAPFSSGERLLAYSARIASDRGHDTIGAIGRVAAPILMIGGSHDHVVSNAATWAVLKDHARSPRAIEIFGAGHYIHDLQHPYLRMLLEDVAAGRPLSLCARISAY
jgi:pimeloyl-ACP methyl ester carboxylesterase